jgi:hypothetical protein
VACKIMFIQLLETISATFWSCTSNYNFFIVEIHVVSYDVSFHLSPFLFFSLSFFHASSYHGTCLYIILKWSSLRNWCCKFTVLLNSNFWNSVMNCWFDVVANSTDENNSEIHEEQHSFFFEIAKVCSSYDHSSNILKLRTSWKSHA